MSLLYYTSAITLEIDPGKCTGCGRCVEVCPHDVFELVETDTGNGHRRRRASIAAKFRCMECGACAMNCKSGAISAGKGVGCAAAIINGMIRGTEPSCDCGGTTGCGSGCN